MLELGSEERYERAIQAYEMLLEDSVVQSEYARRLNATPKALEEHLVAIKEDEQAILELTPKFRWYSRGTSCVLMSSDLIREGVYCHLEGSALNGASCISEFAFESLCNSARLAQFDLVSGDRVWVALSFPHRDCSIDQSALKMLAEKGVLSESDYQQILDEGLAVWLLGELAAYTRGKALSYATQLRMHQDGLAKKLRTSANELMALIDGNLPLSSIAEAVSARRQMLNELSMVRSGLELAQAALEESSVYGYMRKSVQ